MDKYIFDDENICVSNQLLCVFWKKHCLKKDVLYLKWNKQLFNVTFENCGHFDKTEYNEKDSMIIDFGWPWAVYLTRKKNYFVYPNGHVIPFNSFGNIVFIKYKFKLFCCSCVIFYIIITKFKFCCFYRRVRLL